MRSIAIRELQWAQRNFVHALVMVEDRYLLRSGRGSLHRQRYLDDLESRYGGIDSVLLWYIYPNIGIDDRNQFDFAHDLPGGLAGLRGAVADFHQRGVKVFLPTMPWDNGTRPHSEPDWELMAELVAAVGADGINGDTYSGVPRAFFDACAKRGHAGRAAARVDRAGRRSHSELERAELEQEGPAGDDPRRCSSSSGSSRATS